MSKLAIQFCAAASILSAACFAVGEAPREVASCPDWDSTLETASVVIAIVDVDLAEQRPIDGKLVALTHDVEEAWIGIDEFNSAPIWTARLGAVILDRSKPEDDVIARPLGGLLEISAGGDFDFGWSGGVDVYLAREITPGFGVEVRYFNVDFNAAYDYGDTGNMEIGHTTISNLFDVDGAYRSKLYSTEVNVRLPASERVTWLTGFRWLELSERLNYDIDLQSLVNNDFNWNTNNHLYGGQFGVDLRLWDLTSPLSINSTLKAGVYGNDADNHFRYKVNNFSIVQGGRDASAVAFVGDIGVNLSYQLTRHVSLMGGYQLLWINGVALASDQAAYTLQRLNTDVVTTQGDLFYHGASTGAQVTW